MPEGQRGRFDAFIEDEQKQTVRIIRAVCFCVP